MTADRTRWAIVWLMFCAGVVTSFQVGKMPASIPHLQRELGMSLIEAGIAVSIINAVGCLIGLVAGSLADVAGARRVIVTALALIGVASFAGSLVDDPVLLVVSRFFEGLGAIGIFVSGPLIILRGVRAEDTRQAFGIWSAYMPAGVAIMVALTPFLLAGVGWRGVWLVNAVILVAFAAFFWSRTHTVADPPSRDPGRRLAALKEDVRAVVRAPGPWLLGFCFITYTGNFLCVTAFLPVYFIDRLGYAPLTAALLTAVIIAVNVPGNLASGYLAQRGVPRWLLIAVASATMGATTVGIYATGVPGWLPFVLALVFSLVAGLLPAAVFGALPGYAPSPRTVGTSGGLVVQFGTFSQLVCPPLLAAVVAFGGWESAPWFTGGLGAGGVAVALLIGAFDRRLATARANP